MESFFQSFPIWLNLVVFAAGVGAVIKGAEWFTDGTVGIADATGVPKIFIGATIVSLATTSPEMSVSYIAALLNRPATSVGNAVGSTVCNIGLILSLAVLIQPVKVPRTIGMVQGFSMIAAGAAVAALGWDGGLGRWNGFFLLVGAGVYLWVMLRQSGWGNGEPAPETAPSDWGPTVRHFIAGGGCVAGGSVLIVQNAAVLAHAAGVSELVIGLTLVALGTSLPEFVTAISSSLRGHGDIAIGNVIGANVLNLTLVLGGASTILPMDIERQLFALEFPVMGVLMALVVFLAVSRGRIGRRGGAIFFSIYLIYLVLLTVYYL